MQQFFLALIKTTFTQIIGIFGIFFVLGFILSKLEYYTNRNYRMSIGWKGILWTAWIGTPVHEIGHLLFAKFFRHKVEHASFFKPNKETGGLGSVEHSYRKHSIYQNIGNFFIGGAPMIFGSIILLTLLFFLVPNSKEIFYPLKGDVTSFWLFIESAKKTFFNLFSAQNLNSWKFWLFLYLSFCVVSHIAPSKKDRAGMWRGFIWIVFILLVANGIALAMGADITTYVLSVNQYVGTITAIFLYAIIISILHFLVSFVVLFPFRK